MRIVGSTPPDVVAAQPSERPPISLTNAQDVGALLREARERRGISVERLAEITKIRAAFLRAIESNDLDRVPQTVFLRGYLRAYAREVGLDPEETVRSYLDQFAPPEPTVENPTPPVQNSSFGVTPELNWRVLRDLVGVAVIAVVVVLYVIGSRHTAPPAQSAARAATISAPQPRPEVGTAGSLAPAPAAATGHVLHVSLRTSGDCWVSANVDGAQVVYKLLRAGDERVFDVKDQAVLHFGDPAAASLSIDGAPAKSLGSAGVPATVRITKDNFRDYLRR